MNPTSWLAGPGIVGLFGLAAFLIIWLLRIWISQQKSAQARETALLEQLVGSRDREEHIMDQLEEARREHALCLRRQNIMVSAMTRHGIEIPMDAWGEL